MDCISLVSPCFATERAGPKMFSVFCDAHEPHPVADAFSASIGDFCRISRARAGPPLSQWHKLRYGSAKNVPGDIHMTIRAARLTVTMMMVAGLAACGGGSGSGPASSSGFGSGGGGGQKANAAQPARESSVWDLFANRQNPNDAVAVNRYLWNASLEVLNFLPIQSIDPFTGMIVTGYGTPPGGGRSYRATIKVSDPALDARSLKVSLQGANGSAVAPETVRQVEDAILTRARQMRVRDSGL